MTDLPEEMMSVNGTCVATLKARIDTLTAERDRLVKKDAIWAAAFIKAEAQVATLTEALREARLNYLALWDRLALAVDVIEAARGHRNDYGGGQLDDAITVYDATLAALSEGGEG